MENIDTPIDNTKSSDEFQLKKQEGASDTDTNLDWSFLDDNTVINKILNEPLTDKEDE